MLAFVLCARLLMKLPSLLTRGDPPAEDFSVLPARRDVTRDHAKLTRYLSHEADETGVGTRSHVAIYQVTVGNFQLQPNEFEQILTGCPTFRAVTEDADDIPR